MQIAEKSGVYKKQLRNKCSGIYRRCIKLQKLRSARPCFSSPFLRSKLDIVFFYFFFFSSDLITRIVMHRVCDSIILSHTLLKTFFFRTQRRANAACEIAIAGSGFASYGTLIRLDLIF